MWIFQSLVTKSVIILVWVPVLFSSSCFTILIHFSCLGLQCLLPPSIHYPLSLYFNISIFTFSFSFSFNLPHLSPTKNKQLALSYFISYLFSLPFISFLLFTANRLKRVVPLLKRIVQYCAIPDYSEIDTYFCRVDLQDCCWYVMGFYSAKLPYKKCM